MADQPETPPASEPPEVAAPEGEVPRKRLLAKLSEALRSGDAPRMVTAARLARQLLPGDSEFGDPLSTAGSDPSHVLGRQLSALSAEQPSVLGEIGLSALQVWESLAGTKGGTGEKEVAILFTDLVNFSSWALKAGDTTALELLRVVGLAIEPPVTKHDGLVVKRLGDGLMAVFHEPSDAVEAALDAHHEMGRVQVDGHRPQMRAGIHFGRPKTLGGDYLGVDVNIAARVAGAASGGEVLISEAARERLGETPLRIKRRRFFRAKGAPSDLKVFTVARGR